MDNSTDVVDQVVAISDPGDRNRDAHLWGDRLMIRIGNVVAWLFPVLIIAIVSQVFLRKAGHNQAWLDDFQWWLYGTALLTGFGYAITTDSHVRVDILHANFSPEKKARIELFALGWCLLPFLVLMTDILIHYAYSSWRSGEGSDSPNGLHGLYYLKAVLPFLFGAAIIASFAVLYRNLAVLKKPAIWSIILAAFPTVWFLGERLVHYSLWWVVRLTNPDINPRRVASEPIFDMTVWLGLAVVVGAVAVSYLLTRRNRQEA